MKQFNFTFDNLFNPTLEAIHELGGSGTVSEIEEEVARLLSLSDDEVNDIHKGNRTKLSYRLAWSRNYLKRYGLLENSSRGVWGLTQEGKSTRSVDADHVKQSVRNLDLESAASKYEERGGAEEEEVDAPRSDWRDELISLIQGIAPTAFERLCQRILRELGFLNVEVTGRSGDGGIDGKGVYQLGSVLSFHVVFQAKRYSGTVSAGLVRDFRGAMIGRADKGLIITTGTFSREAKREAQRDGAPPIDLMDGYALIENIKALGLGVTVELVEQVTIRKDWFEAL